VTNAKENTLEKHAELSDIPFMFPSKRSGLSFTL